NNIVWGSLPGKAPGSPVRGRRLQRNCSSISKGPSPPCCENEATRNHRRNVWHFVARLIPILHSRRRYFGTTRRWVLWVSLIRDSRGGWKAKCPLGSEKLISFHLKTARANITT